MILDTPLLPIDAAAKIGPVIPHPDFPTYCQAIDAVIGLVTTHRNPYFRTAPSPYVTPSTFFSGVGAARAGNRWNPPGIHTIYLSETPELAMAESLAATRSRGTPDHESLPVTTEAAQVVCFTLLGLSRAGRPICSRH